MRMRLICVCRRMVNPPRRVGRGGVEYGISGNEEQRCRELPKARYENKHRSGGVRDAEG